MCVYKTDDGKCKKFSTGEITSYCLEGPCPHERLTNYDVIRNMSVEEMAEMFDNIDDVTCLACDPRYCDGYGDGINCSHENREKHCHNATVKWLQSEVAE